MADLEGQGPSPELKQLFGALESHFAEDKEQPSPTPLMKTSPVGPTSPPKPPATTSPFGSIMDLAGKLRPTNPPEAGRLDRYAQGVSTRQMPGFTPALDVPVNMALATGYEGLKAGAMSNIPGLSPAAQALLSKMGYEIKPTGQATSPPSLGNVMALYRGLTGS